MESVPHTTLIPPSPLSESELWQVQRRWYEKHAINAWKEGTLPHWISSNSFIAAKYANLILSYSRDSWSKYNSNQPIHIVELGAGHGKLAFLVLRHLVRLREFWPSANCFRYVLTDLNTNILNFWKTHPNLIPFFEDGLLDYSMYDCEDGKDIQLARAGLTLNRSTLQRPIVVLANYVFSSLKQDHYQIFGSYGSSNSSGNRNITIKRANCTIIVPTNEVDPEDSSKARPDVAPKLDIFPTNSEMHFNHIECKDGSMPYDLVDPTLSKVLHREYVDSGLDMSVSVPVGGIKCIRSLQRMTANASMMLLVSDKGFDQKEDYLYNINETEETSQDEKQQDNQTSGSVPHVAFHGSLSFTVNMHCIEQYVRELGGFTLNGSHRTSGFKVQCHLLGESKSKYRSVLRKWKDTMVDFDPDTFASYQKCMREECTGGSPSLKSCLSILRVSYWDSEMFHRLRKAIILQSTRATMKQAEDMVNDAERLWNNVYFLNPAKDIAFELGRVMMGLKRYTHAIGFFTLSNKHYGVHHVTHYNLGICHHYLKKYKFAIEYFDMSLNRCPSYEDAKKWREKSLAELPANTTVTELEEDTLENIEEKRKESGTSGVVVELLE
jgi:tetratricopeptide (TPR) repeat protein